MQKNTIHGEDPYLSPKKSLATPDNLGLNTIEENVDEKEIILNSDKRSIDWVIKECENTKKKFSIRKSKSVKTIKR